MRKFFEKYNVLAAAPAQNQEFFKWFHKGLGLVYLAALFPLFFQIEALTGKNGLMPASRLLQDSYESQGFVKSFLQFPSLFHLAPFDITLYVLTGLGCAGALLLLAGRKPFWGALLAWVSFLSITSTGGDFFVIIIDLFLAETGFLALFSTWYLQKQSAIPRLVDFAFRLLNFRLWFCMGVNKFYMPLDTWSDFTFFDYFFHAQPMPTSFAPVLNASPGLLKYIAIAGLFLAETVIPFFVFGNKFLRKTAFYSFVSISILIQLSGNYGYFNVLSVVLALLILKDGDIKIPGFKAMEVKKELGISRFIKWILGVQVSLQLIYCIYVFNPSPHSPQNQFNFLFSTKQPDNALTGALMLPFKWTEYWRICNPYGVFRSIPCHHGEIRISGSNDSLQWHTYEFKYVPSAYTDYLGFYAPYYPRLDHLFFYETLAAQNYRWNPLNPYSTEKNAWVSVFINKLLENDALATRLLKRNPFEGNTKPKYIRAEVFRLSFSNQEGRNWDAEPMGIVKVFSAHNPCSAPIISLEEALKTTYSKAE